MSRGLINSGGTIQNLIVSNLFERKQSPVDMLLIWFYVLHK